MFLDPQKIVNQLNVSPGMCIADVGSGIGFYTLAFAEALGATGKVYAVDVQKELLDKIHSEAISKNIHIVETIWGDIEKLHGTKLGDGVVDVAAAINIFFQVEEKKVLAEELMRITKPGGRVVVIDWSDSFGGIGPEKEYIVKKEIVTGLLEDVGLTIVEELQTGTHHYGVVFTKPYITEDTVLSANKKNHEESI